MPISKFAFIRLTVLLLLVGLVALLGIVGTSMWMISDAQTNFRLLTESRLQRSALIDFRVLLDDAETGQRGYLLTGRQDYLAPYLEVRDLIPGRIDRLRNLLNADESQRRDVETLSVATAAKLSELRKRLTSTSPASATRRLRSSTPIAART